MSIIVTSYWSLLEPITSSALDSSKTILSTGRTSSVDLFLTLAERTNPHDCFRLQLLVLMARYCGACSRPEAAQYHLQRDFSVACSTFGVAVTKVNILASIVAKTGCWDTVLGAIGDSCSYPLLKTLQVALLILLEVAANDWAWVRCNLVDHQTPL